MSKRQNNKPTSSTRIKRAANVNVGKLIETGYTLQTQGRTAESFKYLEQVLRAEPGNPDAIHLISLGLTNQNRITDAIRFLRKWAAHLKSNNVATQYYIGYGYFLLKRYKLAQEHLKRALDFEPGRAITRLLMARVLIGSGKQDSALKILRRSPAIASTTPENMITYANLLAELEQYQDAKKVILQLPKRGSVAVQRLYELILLPPETWSPEHCDEVVEHLHNPDLSVREKELLNYAAGRIADHQRQYEDAFRYFGNAKKLASHTFDLEELKKAVRVSLSEPEQPARNTTTRSEKKSDMTPVFILGLPRSGKSTLEKLLALNPAVAACGEIPVRLFIDADVFISATGDVPANYDERLKHLKSTQCSMYANGYVQGVYEQYCLPETTQYIINTLPSNYFNIKSLNRIFPKCKFIFITREINDLFIFSYMKHFRNNYSFSQNFDYFAQYYGLIEQQIPKWQKQLGSNFLTIDYTDVVRSPEDTQREVNRFLELADTGNPLSPSEFGKIGLTDEYIGYWKNYRGLFPHEEVDAMKQPVR